MPRYCFNWTLTGSTVIEAPTLEEAKAQWDRFETIDQTITGATAMDLADNEVLVETDPGCFDEVED